MTQETHETTNSIAKIFTWLAWCIFLAALAYAFNDFIEGQHNPNQELSSHSRNGHIEVTLQQNRAGHYVTVGEINNYNVIFLLDTGATEVSIPLHIANNLGLTKQRSFFVETANGRVKVYQTHLSELRIGEIILYNVAAHINPGFDSDEILLGMSALKQLEFRQKGKQLTLLQPIN